MTRLDWLVLVVYLAVIVGVGLWAGRGSGDESEDDFLLGGRNLPWWAALLSLVATEISAATFLGAPEQGLRRDLTYLQFSVGTIAARIFLATFFLTVFYRAGITTVYEFLLTRFGAGTQRITAGLFLFGRLFADASRLFIAALTVEVVAGLPLERSIAILMIATIAYTSFGGIRAVIWTDVVQAFVLVGAGLLLFGRLVLDLNIGFAEAYQSLQAADKLTIFQFDGNMQTDPYFWITAIFGGFVLTLATHGTDHDMVQRLLTCRHDKDARKTMITSGFLGLVVTCLFLSIGLLLFLMLEAGVRPTMNQQFELLAKNNKQGQLLLYYALEALPSGAAGLVIAGLLAAATSSLSSALNAMTATVVNDFLKSGQSESSSNLTRMRLVTVGCGLAIAVLAFAIGVFFRSRPDLDLLSLALGVMTFFYGGLLGIFLVALFSSKRGNDYSNAAGAVFSIAVTYYIGNYTDTAWPWFVVLGTVAAVGISLLGSSPERGRAEPIEKASS